MNYIGFTSERPCVASLNETAFVVAGKLKARIYVSGETVDDWTHVDIDEHDTLNRAGMTLGYCGVVKDSNNNARLVNHLERFIVKHNFYYSTLFRWFIYASPWSTQERALKLDLNTLEWSITHAPPPIMFPTIVPYKRSVN